MKKRAKYFLAGAGVWLLLLGALVSLAVWAWNSAEGTRLLLKTVSFFSPVKIEVEEVRGRLRDELVLRGVSARWAQGELRADRLHLIWQPGELWNRRVHINELSLSGAHFRDLGPEAKKPFFPGWPAVPFWLGRIQGRIDSLRLQELAYLRPNQDPLQLARLFARGEWDGKVLTIQDVASSGPWGSAEGSLKMGVAPPSLILNLKASLAGEYAGMDRLALNLHLAPRDRPDEAAGTIRVSGQKEKAEILSLDGELGLTSSALSWRNLRVLRPGRKGALWSEGSWNFAVRPSLQGRLGFADTDLAPELGMATNLSGELEVKGPLDDYRGRIRLANKAKGWPEADLSGDLRGNLQGVKITSLKASWLGGKAEGSLGFSWAGVPALEGRLQGRKLDPGKFDPDWAGDLNLKIEGKAVMGGNRLSQARIKADFSESRLKGRLFSGEVNTGLEKELWRISQLHLRGQGFALQAEGTLQERVNVEARIIDLSGFLPEARGSVSAAGWVRFRENRFSGTLRGRGNGLVLQKVQAGSFAADLQLKDYPLGGQPVFDLEGRLENIQAGSFPVKALLLQTAGVPKDHKAKLSLLFEEGEIRGELAGGYENGSWKGTVSRLSGKEGQGLWDLQAPAKVQGSPKKILLGPLRLKSERGEKVQVEADLGLEPLSGDLRAEWENLSLVRANPWLGEGKLSGQTAGSVWARTGKSGTQVSAAVSLKGAFARDPFKVEGVSGRARGDWGEKGLEVSAVFDLGREGNLDIRLSSAEAVRAGVPGAGKVEAGWKGVDHALLSSFFPQGLVLKGRSSGQIKGQWVSGGRMEASGKIETSRTRVVLPGEKPVPASLERGELNFTWREESFRGDLFLSLQEHGWLKGDFHLPLAARLPPVFNPEGALNFAFQAELKDQGLLSALYPEVIKKSRANFGANFRAEGTWKRPRFKGTLQLADAGIRFSPGETGPRKSGSRDLFHVEAPSGKAAMEWGERGLRSSATLDFKKYGTLEGKMVSGDPARFALPGEGQLEMTLSGLDLSLLTPLWAGGLSAEGAALAQIKAAWRPDLPLEASGELKIPRGRLSWQSAGGLISAGLNQGKLNLFWGEVLRGNLDLPLEGYGSLKGDFRLPFPARFPLRLDPEGALQAVFRGQAQENGLITAVFPGTVQESRGTLDLDVRIGGTWNNPELKGTARLADAGAFLPGLGIRVEDLSALLLFQEEQVRIESVQARSGPGRVEGNGVIWLKNGRIQRYEGRIWGDKFQTLYLPDLRVQSSPKLEIQGDLKRLSVRGEVRLPEVLVQAVVSPGTVRPSPDVVIVDQPPAEPSSYSLEAEVRIALGEKVSVKAGGVDARLEGNLDLKAEGVQAGQITGRGEIRVKEGSYAGYGLNLRIDRGRFLFAGGPVDDPALDILALRREEDLERGREVKVGVAVLGTVKRPNVKLYSIPAMRDEDILSYLLEGRPYNRETANLSLLVAGAGALLAGDSSGSLDQLKSKIGIDKIGIESESGDLSRSVVTIGKYLTPKLYLSYGYSLFDKEQVLKVRYKLSKSWEVEAQRGTSSAVDLYYRIEFF